MRRVFLSLVLLSLVAPPTLYGVPSLRGRRGFLRVLSARTAPMGDLCINIHGEHAQAHYPRYSAGGDTLFNDWHYFSKLHTGVNYGVVDFLEFSALGNFYMKFDQQIDDYYTRNDEYSIGLQDAELGIKIGAPLAEDLERGMAWAVGLNVFTNFTANNPPDADVEAISRGFYSYRPHYPDAGADLLNDLEVGPLTLLANVGFTRVGKPRAEYDPSLYQPPDTLDRENQVRWGVGVEIEAGPWVRFMTEVGQKWLIDEERYPPDSIWITPGIRFLTPVGVSFDFGCDVALDGDFDWVPDVRNNQDFRNENANWNAIAGITVTSSLRKPPPVIPAATIAGKISDAETREAVGAEITLPGTGYEAFTSDPKEGHYKLVLKPGVYRVHVSKEGYLWQEKPITLKGGQMTVLDFELKRKYTPEGIVTGKIVDAKTQRPVGAKVSFLDTKLPFAASDVETGIYKTKVPPGTYSVKAEAEGYTPETLPVSVVEKQTAFLNFKLHPKVPELVVGERIILRGIYFDTGSATIRPVSYPVLDDAARVLKANPKVRVEIQGHTDSVGSAAYNQRLSEARAASVRGYLIGVGIDAGRLMARGYGESMPVASNATSAGRQDNRRIEFLILGK